MPGERVSSSEHGSGGRLSKQLESNTFPETIPVSVPLSGVDD